MPSRSTNGSNLARSRAKPLIRDTTSCRSYRRKGTQIDSARLPFRAGNPVQQPSIGGHHPGATLVRQHQIKTVVNRMSERTGKRDSFLGEWCQWQQFIEGKCEAGCRVIMLRGEHCAGANRTPARIADLSHNEIRGDEQFRSGQYRRRLSRAVLLHKPLQGDACIDDQCHRSSRPSRTRSSARRRRPLGVMARTAANSAMRSARE
jgi:hypothetical protein